MQNAVSTYLKFIPFQDFNLWDVKRYYNNTKLKFDNVVTLADILIPYKKAVTKDEMIKNKWQIISKINFGGELFLREFEEIHTYKGNVNLVPENAIIYSKINVRHGCIYYHEKGKTPFGVSSEYPTYLFDETKISGKFLHKILRSSAFKKLLNTKTSGISKARVKQDEFLDIQIPLPTLAEQQKIVNAYTTKIQQAQALQAQANHLEEEIENYFLEQLGLKSFELKERAYGLQIVDYTNLDRWDFFSTDNSIASALRKSKFELTTIGNTYEFAKRTFNKQQYKKETFRYIEIGAIDPNKGILEAKEILTKNAPSRATQFVKQGDLILGTTRPYLKKFAIVSNEYDGDVCSSGFSVIAENDNYYLPFLLQFLKCTYGVEQLKNKMTGGLYPAITEVELKEIKVPLPTKEIQVNIMQLIEEKKSNIINNSKSITAIHTDAQQQFEKQIFG